MFSPIDHRPLKGPFEELPPIKPDKLYEYIMAHNGVFLHAKRTGLEVMLQVFEPWSPAKVVRGLYPAEAYIQCDYPKVPFLITYQMLELSQNARDRRGQTVEKLFHLVWQTLEQRWLLVIPEQEQSSTAVRPVGLSVGPGSSYERAFIEVHSHHEMRAFFSGTDDADEQGFKFYGVFGNIFTRPTFRLRIGIYGQWWEVPAADFFELGEAGQPALIQEAFFDDEQAVADVDVDFEAIEESEAAQV